MFILIDDDKLIHLSWILKAKRTQEEVLCFFTVDDFIRVSRSISLDSQIYIDSNLGSLIKGEVESEKIFLLGFKNIFLTTGYLDLDTKKFPWILGVLTKSPPY